MSDAVRGALLLPIGPRARSQTSGELRKMDALLIKVPEAAAQLGVSRAKLYELIASGALPAVKVDGCRRLRVDDLRAYVEGLSTSR